MKNINRIKKYSIIILIIIFGWCTQVLADDLLLQNPEILQNISSQGLIKQYMAERSYLYDFKTTQDMIIEAYSKTYMLSRKSPETFYQQNNIEKLKNSIIHHLQNYYTICKTEEANGRYNSSRCNFIKDSDFNDINRDSTFKKIAQEVCPDIKDIKNAINMLQNPEILQNIKAEHIINAYLSKRSVNEHTSAIVENMINNIKTIILKGYKDVYQSSSENAMTFYQQNDLEKLKNSIIHHLQNYYTICKTEAANDGYKNNKCNFIKDSDFNDINRYSTFKKIAQEVCPKIEDIMYVLNNETPLLRNSEILKYIKPEALINEYIAEKATNKYDFKTVKNLILKGYKDAYQSSSENPMTFYQQNDMEKLKNSIVQKLQSFYTVCKIEEAEGKHGNNKCRYLKYNDFDDINSSHTFKIIANESCPNKKDILNLLEDMYSKKSFSDYEDVDKSFCVDSSSIWQYVGYLLMVLKIIIPLLIIILAMFDLGKAITSQDDSAISKAAGSVGKRIIMGIAIFFVPTIISFVFSLVTAAAPQIKAAEPCQKCLLDPTSETCKIYTKLAEEIKNNRMNESLKSDE